MCKMVASDTLELPYYKYIGRQKVRGFGAFAQVFGRIPIPFSQKRIDPAANCVGAVLLEFVAP